MMHRKFAKLGRLQRAFGSVFRSDAVLLALLAGALPEFAEARFQTGDSSSIDREASISSEYYNDIISYRFSPWWDELWQQHRLGYRLSAGSLNAKRFYYLEDLKLKTSSSPQEVGLAFKQVRVETMYEQSFEHEVAILLPISGEVSTAILGEGGTYKKWGDIGLALIYGSEEKAASDWYGRLAYWSVDHYYNTKEDEAGDRYLRKAYSLQGDLAVPLPGKAHLQAAWAYDSPVLWQRPSQGYLYRYERHRSSADLAINEPWPGWVAHVQVAMDRKREALQAYRVEAQAASASGGEALKRQTVVGELNLGRREGRSYHKGGLMYLTRHGQYEPTEPLPAPASASADRPLVMLRSAGAHDAYRREWMAYVLWSSPRPAYLWQWGLTYNRMTLEDEGYEQRGELKLQTAIDWDIGAAAHLALNFTWDLDELYRLRLTPFRPWGGGNIQMMALF